MSQDETDEQIKKRLNTIFPNPDVAAQIVDLVTSERPAGWSRKSNAPYFKRIYGEQMKQEIDKQIVHRQPIVYRYDIWCDESTGGMSCQTLYNRINQSIRYVVEKMDPNHVYANWYETVQVSRTKGVGVEIIPISIDRLTTDGFSAEVVHPKDEGPRWRRRLDEWLESDDTDIPFVQEHLCLTPEEIVQLKAELAGLQNIAVSISSAAVKIIKVNE